MANLKVTVKSGDKEVKIEIPLGERTTFLYKDNAAPGEAVKMLKDMIVEINKL